MILRKPKTKIKAYCSTKSSKIETIEIHRLPELFFAESEKEK